MNRGLFAIACALVAACGDPPICPSDVFIAIQTSEISSDVDAAATGVQADIRVRTSLIGGTGDEVTLEVSSSTGTPLGTATAVVDETGVAIFHGVTVTNPGVHLRASFSVQCGTAVDELDVPVTAGSRCDLVVSPTPAANTFYAPARVLNALDDPDATTPGLQAKLIIDTTPASKVELFANTGGGDQSLGSFDAGDTGIVEIDRALLDGRQQYRALCSGGSTAALSPTIDLVVDTTPPRCTFAIPTAGTTITPSFDTNLTLSDGIQMFTAVEVDGGDAEGEPATLSIAPLGGTPVDIPNVSAVDATGTAGADITLDPATTPATFRFVFGARDHANNACTAVEDFDVVYNGCDLVITAPTAPVTVDADGNSANGSQVDITAQVGTECIGRTVTSTCGSNHPSGVVDGSGHVTLRADWCGTSPCELTASCNLSVTTTAGVVTTAGTTIVFDDQGPTTSVAVVNPAVACGTKITPAADTDPNTTGVQVVARVTATGATTQSLEQTSGAGTTTVPASTDVTITVAPGINSLVGIAADALGNTTRTAACTITLDDLTVSFSPPASDGLVNRKDGTVTGTNLTFPLCGTVNRTGAAVALTIDNGAPITATVTGTTWCANVTLAESPPAHTIVANATAGTSAGSSALVLTVDLTLPPPVDAFFAQVTNRHTIALAWNSPSDNGQPVVGYIAKISTTAFTQNNFDTTGTVLPTSTPQPIGTAEAVDFDTARVGTSYFAGVATVDAAGNRSTVAIVGPLTPDLDRSGGIAGAPLGLGQLRFGTAIAHGKFNDDDIDDLAVAAPTQQNGGTANAGAVYIYFGTPGGISAVPDAVITSAVSGGRFGSGLTALHRPGATRDDLAVGAPGLATHGTIAIFAGGPTFTAGARDATTADLVIAPDPVTPGAFANGSFGATLITADVDGDGTGDLVASLPTGNTGSGGAAIVYGDTLPPTGTVHLSDLDASGANGAIAELFTDTTFPNRKLGTYLHNVGPTAGPFDVTDDLVIALADDNTTQDSVFVLRGNGSRPAAAGVTLRPFVSGRDVRIDYVSPNGSVTTEFGAQATSISDQDNDGARELVLSAHRNNNDRGQVVVITGDTLGTAGVASTSDFGVVLTSILGSGNVRLVGALLLVNDTVSDFDNDGLDDLLVVARTGTTSTGFLWFGGTLPAGPTTTATAPFSLPTPTTFKIGQVSRPGSLGVASWVGDLDNDGVPDVCWASPVDAGDDGSFEVFD